MNTPQRRAVARRVKRTHATLAEERKRRKEAWWAFIWHTAELALVLALLIEEPSLFVAGIFALSLLGWGWSLGHLPGQKA